MSDTRPRLLVIDDEEEVRDMLSFGLTQSGYCVATASGGAEGVELVRRETFDLVITDLKMPGMDGLATTLALRARRPDLHVVIVSGYVPADGVAACLASGASAFLRKPFELEELEMLVRRTLESSPPKAS